MTSKYLRPRCLLKTMSKQHLKSFRRSRSTRDRSETHLIPPMFLADRAWDQASDLASTSRLLVAIITISKDSGDWSLLNEQILLLSKKHGQLKQATTKMVQVAMSFIDEAPDAEKKLALIETLRTVTEGKVWPNRWLQHTRIPSLTWSCRSLLKSSEHVSPAFYRI